MAAGTKNSSSFSLNPVLSWSPEACITVYCSRSNGEVTWDTARLLINQQNYVLCLSAFSLYSLISNKCVLSCFCLVFCVPQVSLKWSRTKARQGEQVSLSVTTLVPNSQIGIVIMGSHDDTQEDDRDLIVEQV